MLGFAEYHRLNESAEQFPATLLLRRIAIRQFPNGKNVALYWSDALKKYIAYPAMLE